MIIGEISIRLTVKNILFFQFIHFLYFIFNTIIYYQKYVGFNWFLLFRVAICYIHYIKLPEKDDITMKEKLEILLVEDDPETCAEFAELIYDTDELILIGVTNNDSKALDYIRDSQPDVVILDLELHHGSGNGLNVLNNMRNIELKKRPYMLITTNNSSTFTYESARTLGADFIMSKHQENYSVSGVLDFLHHYDAMIKCN